MGQLVNVKLSDVLKAEALRRLINSTPIHDLCIRDDEGDMVEIEGEIIDPREWEFTGLSNYKYVVEQYTRSFAKGL